MGIPGLLRDLEKSRIPCQLEELVATRAAIDVSDWIYKALSVPYGSFDPKQYIYGRLTRLRLFKIEPVLVFDGQELPAKKEIHEGRKALRAKRLLEAEKLLEEGKDKEAALRRKGTAERSGELLKALKDFCVLNNIKYVQAPYEADAQIAYLVQQGLVDYVISQDSDMMVYGCDKVLYKLTSGRGELFEQSQIEKSWKAPYDAEAFRAVSILMGCDYLKGGLPGFGIMAARKLYSKLAKPFDFQQMMALVSHPVPAGFEEKFFDAVNVFKYQLVFDTVTKTVVPLTPYPKGKHALDFPGAGIPFLAKGEVFNPEYQPISSPVWLGSRMSRVLCCSKCTHLFPNYLALREHRLKLHSFECPICPRSFTRVRHRDLHLHKHDEKSIEICNICNKEYLSLYRLTSHQIQYHGVRTYFCSFCPKYFDKRASLRAHTFSRHSNEKKNWMCDQCGKMFKWGSSLAAHLECIHSTERRFACNLCTKSFKTRNNLLSHLRTHTAEKPFECIFCGEAFTTNGIMQRHLRTHTEEKPYFCDVCGMEFAASDARKRHLRTHTGVKPYICNFCGKGFSQKGGLRDHLNAHTGEKPFKCDQCGNGFATTGGLRVHRRAHTGEKPFKCDFCGLGCTTSAGLQKHRRTHTGEKPYVCDICGTGFAQKQSLKRHMLKHTGEKPHNCDICGMKFARKDNLQSHQKKIHK